MIFVTVKAKQIVQPEGPGGGKGEPGVPPIQVHVRNPRRTNQSHSLPTTLHFLLN